jgi:hypothetical protein
MNKIAGTIANQYGNTKSLLFSVRLTFLIHYSRMQISFILLEMGEMHLTVEKNGSLKKECGNCFRQLLPLNGYKLSKIKKFLKFVPDKKTDYYSL